MSAALSYEKYAYCLLLVYGFYVHSINDAEIQYL